MSNDLATPAEIAYLPGAPFTDAEVDAAVAALREALEWHIAPVRSETVVCDVERCQARLLLPTRKLVSVVEVRSDAVAVDPTTYEVSPRLGQIVKKTGTWPAGFGTVEIDITHGHQACPLELLAVIAETATSQRLLAVRAPVIDQPAMTGDGVSAGIVSANPLAYRVLKQDVLQRYSLRWLPGLA